MDDLISRQAASGCEYWDSESNFCSLYRPSAERRGKKKVYYHGENTFSYVCDQCAMPIDGKDAFCRWCGAKMEV